MAVFELRPPLTAEERVEKRRIILRDSIALLGLFAITVVLAIVTYVLFGTFSRHRDVLARRWKANGVRALSQGKPKIAVQDLRSALEYAPGRRDIEVELAGALAASGRDLEAAAYFNSLLETQPGNAFIHLQLARLAAKQGNATLAEQHYQNALDGTWEGDGYVRRREVRVELAGYLISRKNFMWAQSELRTASGNAPDEPGIQFQIAGLMEQAQDPADALQIYQRHMRRRNAPVEALEGAGRTAYVLGEFDLAHESLGRAVQHASFAKQSEAERQGIRSLLASCTRILALYPNPDMNVRARASRVLTDSKIARARLTSCFATTNAAGEMAALQGRWQQLPSGLTVRELEQNPQLEQTIMGLRTRPRPGKQRPRAASAPRRS